MPNTLKPKVNQDNSFKMPMSKQSVNLIKNKYISNNRKIVAPVPKFDNKVSTISPKKQQSNPLLKNRVSPIKQSPQKKEN